MKKIFQLGSFALLISVIFSLAFPVFVFAQSPAYYYTGNSWGDGWFQVSSEHLIFLGLGEYPNQVEIFSNDCGVGVCTLIWEPSSLDEQITIYSAYPFTVYEPSTNSTINSIEYVAPVGNSGGLLDFIQLITDFLQIQLPLGVVVISLGGLVLGVIVLGFGLRFFQSLFRGR